MFLLLQNDECVILDSPSKNDKRNMETTSRLVSLGFMPICRTFALTWSGQKMLLFDGGTANHALAGAKKNSEKVTFGANDWKIEPLSVNPLIGASAETLIKVGAWETNLIVNEGQWCRVFAPIVLHAGVVHFIVNMLAAWCIGAAVEQSHGFASATILFLIPAVGGNILSAIFLPQHMIGVGASGGIFGLMVGGSVADIAINWNLLFLKTTTDENARSRHLMVLLWLFVDVILNAVIGFTPFVDNFTHVGGFLHGPCWGLSTMEQLAVGFFGLTWGKLSRFRNTFVRFFGLIFSVVAIMVLAVLLVRSDGETSPCNSCRHVSCMPFPFGEDKWWHCDDWDFVTANLFQATNGSGLYKVIELTCPGGNLAEIAIHEEGCTEREEVR
jgi:membrane associated rhomboid family serine protease